MRRFECAKIADSNDKINQLENEDTFEIKVGQLYFQNKVLKCWINISGCNLEIKLI